MGSSKKSADEARDNALYQAKREAGENTSITVLSAEAKYDPDLGVYSYMMEFEAVEKQGKAAEAEKKVEEQKKEAAAKENKKVPAPQLTGSYDNLTKELRNTPGYTNYVVSTQKNIDGTIASSSVFKRYYSDISAEAYINGVWFEDINTIQWQVNQQQMPLFGYNSYIYDDMAVGVRIIQGQFSINFTEPNIIGKAIAQGAKSASVNNGSTYEAYSTQAHKNKVAIDGTEITYQSNELRNAIWRPRFDIDIVFGEKEKLGGVDLMPKHIILWDCTVSSSGIGVSANGGVLVENYMFMARDFKIIS